jgi:hypothetical protein
MHDSDYLRLVSELLGDPLPQGAYVCAYDLLLMELADDKDQYRSKFIAHDATHANWELSQGQVKFLRQLLVLIADGRAWPPGWALTLLARVGDDRAVEASLRALTHEPEPGMTAEDRMACLRYVGHFLNGRAAREIVTTLRSLERNALGETELDLYVDRLLARVR